MLVLFLLQICNKIGLKRSNECINSVIFVWIRCEATKNSRSDYAYETVQCTVSQQEFNYCLNTFQSYKCDIASP